MPPRLTSFPITVMEDITRRHPIPCSSLYPPRKRGRAERGRAANCGPARGDGQITAPHVFCPASAAGRLQRPPTAAFGSPDLLRRWQLLHRLLGSLERLLRAFVQNELIALGRDFAELAHHCAGSGRDQPPDDDVLLKAVQRIDLAVDRRLGENPGGLLERCRRNERAGLERGLGDAEENRIA